jgi:4-amino-4-deoxy-L-arabinose transferase-like glycosyltransferase
MISARREMLLVAALGTGLILPFVLIHVDDPDAMLYTVIARNLAADGTPLHLRFLQTQWPSFYEHPPLFFAIQAIFVRLFGSGSLPWLGAAIGLSTLLVTYALGVELLGRRAAFLGAVILALTESFFRYQGRARLDPPLTLAMAASVALLVTARGRTSRLCLGGLVAGLGALIKGPPAFAAPVAAALILVSSGRFEELRRARDWFLVAGSMLVLPIAFLLYDQLGLEGAWWKGYVDAQLVASLVGKRSDGWTDRSYLARGLIRRFHPGLVFVLAAIVLLLVGRFGRRTARAADAPAPSASARDASVRSSSTRSSGSTASNAPAPSAWLGPRIGLLAWGANTPAPSALLGPRIGLLAWAALILLGFSLGGRAWWVYAMPGYVPLALVAGAGADALLGRLGGDRAFRFVQRAVAVAATVLILALPLRLAKFLVPPCPFSGLARAAEMRTGAEARIALVMPSFDLGYLAYLAEHTMREVAWFDRASAASIDPAIETAVVSGSLWPLVGWTALSRNEAWILAAREQR